MSTTFDAYQAWLGIPPAEQPPNHYRLLGVRLFERDRDTIAQAAQKRLAVLRGLLKGEHRARAQQLGREIMAARDCLLDPMKNQAYAAEFHARTTAPPSSIGVAAASTLNSSVPPPVARPIAAPVAATPVFASDHGESIARHVSSKKGTPWPLILCGVGGVLCVLLVLLVMPGEKAQPEPRTVTEATPPAEAVPTTTVEAATPSAPNFARPSEPAAPTSPPVTPPAVSSPPEVLPPEPEPQSPAVARPAVEPESPSMPPLESVPTPPAAPPIANESPTTPEPEMPAVPPLPTVPPLPGTPPPTTTPDSEMPAVPPLPEDELLENGNESTNTVAVTDSEVPPPEPPKTGHWKLTRSGVPVSIYLDVLMRYQTPAIDGVRIAAWQEILKKQPEARMARESNEEATWNVYVPQSYDGTVPYGLLVWVLASDEGDIHRPWIPLYDKHRIIVIAGNMSGNKQDIKWRQAMAVTAAMEMQRTYEIETKRVYVSGNSGGGRLASHASHLHPDVFTGGGYYVTAANQCLHPLLRHFTPPPAPVMQTVMNERRHAFIYGDKDKVSNPKDSHDLYAKAPYAAFTAIVVPGMGHALPNAEWYEKGILALDAPVKAAAPSLFDAARKMEERGKRGRLLAAYRQAAACAIEGDIVDKSVERITALKTEYDAAIAELEKLLTAGNRKPLVDAIADFRREWEPVGLADATRLAQAARELD
jgi:dienelactone hydrolase